MKKLMWFTIGFFPAAVLLLAVPHYPAFALPYTSWHATFVHLPGEGVDDATAMRAKFDAWKWGPDAGPKKGWETSIFTANKVSDIRDAFKWLRDRQGENEILVFYYAGHSFSEDAEENKSEESSTEDTPPPGSPPVDERDEGIQTDSEGGFFDDQIGEELRDLLGYTVSIFDSCFSGGMVDGTSDVNGKKKDGSNKKDETVIMGAREYETCLTRKNRGVFSEYLLKEFPAGDPTSDTFSTWWFDASISYRSDFKKNPESFNDPKTPGDDFQSFQLTEYKDGDKESQYKPRIRNGVPEPAAYTLLGFGLLGIVFIMRLNRSEVNYTQS